MAIYSKKDAVQALISKHERQNQEIAASLHDSIGQLLSTVLLHLKDYKKKPQKRNKQLDIAIDLVEKASQELREIYSFIYPAILEHLGLVDTIEWYSDKFLREKGIACVTNIQLTQRLPQALELNLFRIVQEALSNIYKHSQATEVHIVLQKRQGAAWDKNCAQPRDEVFFAITDNGHGFDTKHELNPHSYGLKNIKTRVRNLKGHYRLATDHKGTKINIRLPLDQSPMQLSKQKTQGQ